MDKQRQEQAIIALKEKGAIQPCPRCTTLEFEILGETKIPLTDRQSPFSGHYPEVPVILVSCKNCGFIAQHAAGPLGVAR